MNLKYLILFATLTLFSKQEVVLKCFFYIEEYFAIYNSNLKSGQYKDIPYTFAGKNGKLRVNICGSFEIPVECKTEGIERSSIMFISDKGDCIDLISEHKSENLYEIIDKSKPLNGIKIKKKDQEFNTQLVCDKDQTEPKYEINNNNNLLITTQDACGKKNEFAEFISQHKFIYSISLIAIGLLFLLIGGSKWDIILTVTGFIVGCGGIWFIFWAFVNFKQTTTSYIIIAILSIIVGILIASLCNTFTILSYFLLGFAAGFVLSQYLLILLKFKGEEWVYNLIIIGTGCVLGAICTFAQKYILALITAVIGGLIVSFNFGFLIGALGNFYDVLDKLKNGDDLKPAYYIFFFIFIILSCFGFFFQVNQIKKENQQHEFIQSEFLIQLNYQNIFKINLQLYFFINEFQRITIRLVTIYRKRVLNLRNFKELLLKNILYFNYYHSFLSWQVCCIKLFRIIP